MLWAFDSRRLKHLLLNPFLELFPVPNWWREKCLEKGHKLKRLREGNGGLDEVAGKITKSYAQIIVPFQWTKKLLLLEVD